MNEYSPDEIKEHIKECIKPNYEAEGLTPGASTIEFNTIFHYVVSGNYYQPLK